MPEPDGVRKVQFASRACLAHGCMAETDGQVSLVCLADGCAAREYGAKAQPKPDAGTVSVSPEDAMLCPGCKKHMMFCTCHEPDAGKVGSGFPGMKGDIAAHSPTPATKAPENGAETDWAALFAGTTDAEWAFLWDLLAEHRAQQAVRS